MSLSSLLPAPKNAFESAGSIGALFAKKSSVVAPTIESATAGGIGQLVAAGRTVAPPYGSRRNFVPRNVDDFGDGGSFPEVHTLQYPLHMGKKDGLSSSVALLAVDEKGEIKYDAIARQGSRRDVTIFSSFKDLLPKHMGEDELARPSQEEEAKVAEATRRKLGLIVEGQAQAARPTHIKTQKAEPVFIRYTPSQQKKEFNSGATQRVIKLQEMPLDPMEPPKFQHKRMVAAPPSPPPPVMHSPQRKITAEDQNNWKIPPCVSNWKNIKGYTIPLDKRLAADGRGLQEVQVNDKFAKLAESLFLAGRTARKEIEARNNLHKRLARQQNEVKEQKLRELAAKARQEGTAKARLAEEDEDEDTSGGEDETEADTEARAEREELRKDRKRDLRRDLRMSHMGTEKQAAKRAGREADRDISEKIALGMAVPSSGGVQFDQRLFNQEAGMGAGFAGDDDYSVYDKPLFKGTQATYIYRKKDDEEMTESDVANLIEKSTSKFKADRGFEGAERSSAATSSRDKPVAFEKESDDPFQIDELLGEKGEERGGDKLASVSGGQAPMNTATRANYDSYSRDQAKGGTGRKMAFEESSESASKRRKQ